MNRIPRLIFFSIFVISLFSSCLSFRDSDRKLYKGMAKDNLYYEINFSPSDTVRWLWYKNKDRYAPLLLFIHGAPGSSSSFLSYIKNEQLRKYFSIIIVDRPGYGYSAYGRYEPIPQQYEAIENILIAAGITREVYTVGHSYGGTIAGYIAILDPDWLSGTVMIAPAIDPNEEKYLWYGKLALYKCTRWLAPKSLQVAADEKYNHEDELGTFINDWHKISKPILHIHGDKDDLVPYGNVSFSKKHIPEKWLDIKTIENKGHLLPFKEKELIVTEIMGFVSRVDSINSN
jgi:pimeloyl-ACP methyl ester carboxylesterase